MGRQSSAAGRLHKPSSERLCLNLLAAGHPGPRGGLETGQVEELPHPSQLLDPAGCRDKLVCLGTGKCTCYMATLISKSKTWVSVVFSEINQTPKFENHVMSLI